MNEEQKLRAIQIWRKYCEEGKQLVTAIQKFTHEEQDKQRNLIIPLIIDILQRYLLGEIQLDEFKTRIDSINKRNQLWGFKGINGQMLFNMLTRTRQGAEKTDEFEQILKIALPLPSSIEQATKTMDEFAIFTKNLARTVKDQREAPKVRSIPFFLSYFWQIQSPQTYPVYYVSMLNALQEYNIWFPLESIGESYASFYHLNHELQELLSRDAGHTLNLWDVEHAFWYIAQPHPEPPPVSPVPPVRPVNAPAQNATEVELPDSYIPPIVSILPRLAINDPLLAKQCQAMGSSIEKVFEQRVDVLFQMLGYETEALGQGHGRVPDGVAICREFHYAIGYDAKVRQQPYTMGTDERAIREYINGLADRLRRQGVRQIYFMVISSAFSGDHDDVIRSLKMDTDVREILLVEASALVALLEVKLRNPLLSLGPEGIQRLLADSGVLTEADVKEFQGL